MQVSFQAFRLNNVNAALFKGHDNGANHYVNVNRSDKLTKVAQIERDYCVKSDYLNELRDEVCLSGRQYNFLQKKLDKEREVNIKNIISDDFSEEDEDFIEKLMY